MTFYSELDLRYAQWELEQIKRACAVGDEIEPGECRHKLMQAQFRVEHIARRLEVQPKEELRLNNLWHARSRSVALESLLDEQGGQNSVGD